MGTWRKACGAIKDSTEVGLAKVNSEHKELDIAIVKATNHLESPPKERHVRKIFAAISVVRPRADLAYCIYALAKRLSKTHNWVVALKTLIVIHRTLREGDSTFREELLNYAQKGHVLRISNFKDNSSPLAWDCSSWVQTYALFLEERLECFRVLKYDIEADRAQVTPKGHSRTRTLACPDLLEQMPALQQLLYRLVGCHPEGAACGNYLVQYASALVLKESFKIYCGINDGIINLVDMFFEMSKYDAIKALEIYKRAGQQAESLSNFYEFCKKLDLARNFQFPTLKQPPPSFVTTMEEYIRDAPSFASVSCKDLEYEEKKLVIYKEKEAEEQPGPSNKNPEPTTENIKNEKEEPLQDEEPPPLKEVEDEPETTGDLLGLDEINPVAAEIEQCNALAFAIIQPGDNSKATTSTDLQLIASSGWELALVTTTSNNTSHVVESKLAGGFDKLLLDSLYEDTSRRQQIAGGTYIGSLNANSLNSKDPFFMSSSIAPPTNVQMAALEQQQQQYYQQQQQLCYKQHQLPYYYHQQQQQQQQQTMVTVHYGYQTQNSHQQQMGLANPFGDSYNAGFSQCTSAQGNASLL